MSKIVLATMDSNGHLRVYDMTDDEKAKKKLQKLFEEYDVWGEEDVQEAVKNLDWDFLGQLLTETCGFPQHGRELFVNLEDEIVVNDLL